MSGKIEHGWLEQASKFTCLQNKIECIAIVTIRNLTVPVAARCRHYFFQIFHATFFRLA